MVGIEGAKIRKSRVDTTMRNGFLPNRNLLLSEIKEAETVYQFKARIGTLCVTTHITTITTNTITTTSNTTTTKLDNITIRGKGWPN